MKVRPLRDSDIPILESWTSASGFEYPDCDDPLVEKILVVADDDDRPILVVPAKRLVEIYGWFNPGAGSALRNEAIALMQPAMIEELKKLGYKCAETFIYPKLERRGFGRILTERFGWHRNLISYGKRFL